MSQQALPSKLCGNMIKKSLYITNIFFLYLAVWYVPGLLSYFFFSEHFTHYYNLDVDINFWNILWLFLIIASMYMGAALLSPLQSYNLHFPMVLGRSIILLSTLLFLFLSISFFIHFSSHFRHSDRLSNVPSWVSVLWLLKPISYVILLSIYLTALNRGYLNMFARSILIILFFAFGLSITGSLQVIAPLIILYVFYCLKKDSFKNNSKLSIFSMLLGIFLTFFAGILVLLVGVGSKVGYDAVFSLDFVSVVETLTSYLPVLTPRIATSTVSFLHWSTNSMSDNVVNFDLVQSFLDTFRFRLCSLMGDGCAGFDLIDTVNRFNYLHVFRNHAERAGASPGLFASIFFAGGPFVGLVVISLLFGLVVNLISKNVVNITRKYIVFYFPIPYFVMYFLEAPLNIFYLIDPAFFLFIFFVFYMFSFKFDKLFGVKFD